MIHSLISMSVPEAQADCSTMDGNTLDEPKLSLPSAASNLTEEILCMAQAGITLVANVVDEKGQQVIMEALDAALFPDPQRRAAVMTGVHL
jgi:hypothetical protein